MAARSRMGGGRSAGAAVLLLAGMAQGQINESFDATAAGSLPLGWSTSSTGAGAPWSVVNTAARSVPNSVFTNGPQTLSSQFLQLPPITAIGPVTIDFWRRFQTEATPPEWYDGWVLEASINGSAFTNVGASAWRLNGYNGIISPAFSSVLAGQWAFSGMQTTWTRSIASIPAASGDQVVLRFHMACDSSVESDGVWIDDVAVTTSATGVCCLHDGSCQVSTVPACTAAGGTFSAAADCLSANCPAPGACCYLDGTCVGNMQAAACLAGGGVFRGQNTTCGSIVCGVASNEVEPNEMRSNATVVNLANQTDFIRGNSTGSTTTAGAGNSLDQFLVRTPALPLGIYRHQLVITTSGFPGHTGSIRGLTQTGAAAGAWPGPVGTATTVDTAAQVSTNATTPARMNQWYGFGKQEQIYYRIAGAAGTMEDYYATWTYQPVQPTDIGSFAPGMITIATVGQGHATDTDLWVYNSSFDPINGFGNDGASTHGGAPANTSANSWLQRQYAPGTYYLALTNFDLANNKGSPSDDNRRTGVMLDFPGVLTCSSAAANVNLGFQVRDSAGVVQFTASKPAAYDVAWYKFTVGPAGSSCYANCDGSTQVPFLNAADFSCFLQKFIAGDPYANCDGSAVLPVLNILDFACFMQKFAAGCTAP